MSPADMRNAAGLLMDYAIMIRPRESRFSDYVLTFADKLEAEAARLEAVSRDVRAKGEPT